MNFCGLMNWSHYCPENIYETQLKNDTAKQHKRFLQEKSQIREFCNYWAILVKTFMN